VSEWTLITVSYNSARTLERHWAGFDRSAARWIVVDNASTDDSAEVATRLGADVVRLDRNRGFSYANNVALRAATSKYVAFCNPDVEVDLASLEVLAGMVRERGAFVAPQLLNTDGTVQSSARGLPFLVDKLAHRGVQLPGSRVAEYLPQVTGTSPVCWAMGAALCGTRADLLRIGGWNDAFFIYYEDHDIGLRAWRHGIPVLVTAEVRWRHAWARETTAFRMKPWIHEVASAARFYRRYPELLLPTRRWAARRHAAYLAARAAQQPAAAETVLP
jgi:N-acetylglucosaminyl-diphospho-decaprenol L-rhamnosyltransferase